LLANEDDDYGNDTEDDFESQSLDKDFAIDAPSYEGPKAEEEFGVDIEHPRHMQFWNSTPAYDDNICFKCFKEDGDIQLFLEKRSITYKKLLHRLRKMYWAKILSVKYSDDEDDLITLTSNEGLKAAKQLYLGRTLCLHVEVGELSIPSSKTRSLSNSTVATLIIKSEGSIVFANPAAVTLLQGESKEAIQGKDFNSFLSAPLELKKKSPKSFN